jgi:hypothetical protein
VRRKIRPPQPIPRAALFERRQQIFMYEKKICTVLAAVMFCSVPDHGEQVIE